MILSIKKYFLFKIGGGRKILKFSIKAETSKLWKHCVIWEEINEPLSSCCRLFLELSYHFQNIATTSISEKKWLKQIVCDKLISLFNLEIRSVCCETAGTKKFEIYLILPHPKMNAFFFYVSAVFLSLFSR